MDVSRDFFWIDELFRDPNIELPPEKRMKFYKQELINSVVQSGFLDEVWEDELEDEFKDRRKGRTKKMDYFNFFIKKFDLIIFKSNFLILSIMLFMMKDLFKHEIDLITDFKIFNIAVK
jgi:uncharacterized protein YneR